MPEKPWWETGQHAAAFNRGSTEAEPCIPQSVESPKAPKLGLYSGPKPPKLHREEIEREAREKAARDKYLSSHLENENFSSGPTPKLDNSL